MVVVMPDLPPDCWAGGGGKETLLAILADLWEATHTIFRTTKEQFSEVNAKDLSMRYSQVKMKQDYQGHIRMKAMAPYFEMILYLLTCFCI